MQPYLLILYRLGETVREIVRLSAKTEEDAWDVVVSEWAVKQGEEQYPGFDVIDIIGTESLQRIGAKFQEVVDSG